MANTYSQLNIHAVFAVKGRQNLLLPHFRYELFKYMSGILSNDGSFPLAVGGWYDHVHVFFELQPVMSISKQIQVLKASSSKWINENHFLPGKFNWQEGYGAFSYSRWQRDRVIKYILHQEEHHRKQTFKTEYLKILDQYNIPYDEKYLFDFMDV